MSAFLEYRNKIREMDEFRKKFDGQLSVADINLMFNLLYLAEGELQATLELLGYDPSDEEED